jgi:hypothetical protein
LLSVDQNTREEGGLLKKLLLIFLSPGVVLPADPMAPIFHVDYNGLELK